jgi:23S rRNA (adenine2030-N6)-methyltransferase
VNYRHAFHAGNYADVVKHVILAMLIEHLKAKPAPFMYLDTHAGRGRYDLSHAQPQRSGEYLGGIGRLLKVPAAGLPAEVAAYLDIVRRSAGPERSPITAYPGSPLIVELLRRPTDRMVLVEKHASEAAALREAIGRARRVTVLEQDGYAALKAQLPPVERRGLVLIDPPYESESEFDAVVAALMQGQERWPTGMYCVWYPQSERAGSLRFHRELRESGIRRVLDAQLSVLPPDSAVGMQGCGLAIVNPPWQLDLRLAQLLPKLHALLAPDGAGAIRVDWLVPE